VFTPGVATCGTAALATHDSRLPLLSPCSPLCSFVSLLERRRTIPFDIAVCAHLTITLRRALRLCSGNTGAHTANTPPRLTCVFALRITRTRPAVTSTCLPLCRCTIACHRTYYDLPHALSTLPLPHTFVGHLHSASVHRTAPPLPTLLLPISACLPACPSLPADDDATDLPSVSTLTPFTRYAAYVHLYLCTHAARFRIFTVFQRHSCAAAAPIPTYSVAAAAILARLSRAICCARTARRASRAVKQVIAIWCALCAPLRLLPAALRAAFLSLCLRRHTALTASHRSCAPLRKRRTAPPGSAFHLHCQQPCCMPRAPAPSRGRA